MSFQCKDVQIWPAFPSGEGKKGFMDTKETFIFFKLQGVTECAISKYLLPALFLSSLRQHKNAQSQSFSSMLSFSASTQIAAVTEGMFKKAFVIYSVQFS